MAYVYISDIGQAPPAPPANPEAQVSALETKAKALDLAATAASVASPTAAANLRAQAEAARKQAQAIRAELEGLSLNAKLGIGAALLAAAGGAWCLARRKPQMRMNRRRR